MYMRTHVYIYVCTHSIYLTAPKRIPKKGKSHSSCFDGTNVEIKEAAKQDQEPLVRVEHYLDPTTQYRFKTQSEIHKDPYLSFIGIDRVGN